MILFQNILKVAGVIIVGYLVGFIIGGIIGALSGIFFSFIIQDIVSYRQVILISIFITITLGGLLGFLSTKVSNMLFESNINKFIGPISGALYGLVMVVFAYGYIGGHSSNSFFVYKTVRGFFMTPIMFYSGLIGRVIGAVIFPFFAAIGVIRELYKSNQELQRNRELMKNLPASHWGLPEAPLKTQSDIRSNPPAASLFPRKPVAQGKGGFLRFLAKTTSTACATGVVLSILGWQIFGWNSSSHFSNGFFMMGATLAMFGYFNMKGEHNMNQNRAMRFGEAESNLNTYEQTKLRFNESENNFAFFLYCFFISVYLIGFSILITIIFQEIRLNRNCPTNRKT